jgi:hypothetical protein
VSAVTASNQPTQRSSKNLLGVTSLPTPPMVVVHTPSLCGLRANLVEWLLGDPDQPARLGLLNGVITGDLGQRVQIERFTETQHLQRVQHRVRQRIDPSVQ